MQNDVADLNTVMNTSAGMMSYFAKFWRGFYPLLIVELVEKTDSLAVKSDYAHTFWKMEAKHSIHPFFRIQRTTQILQRQWAASTNSSGTYTTFRLRTYLLSHMLCS